MKKLTLILSFMMILTSGISQTPITDDNFHQAINTCLSTNPVDGLCYDCEYGAMPDWDVSAVTVMSEAFYNKTDFNANISNWNVSNVYDMNYLFAGAHAFNKNIGNWDVSNVLDMNGMFAWAFTFNQDIGDWDVSNVTDMNNLFHEAWEFNQEINKWNVSNVVDMNWMFAGADAFDHDIGNWDVTNVTNMNMMFGWADSFNRDIGTWDVSNVLNMDEMFENTESFNRDLSTWCVEQIPTQPTDFASGCPLFPQYHPNWGEECDTTVFISNIDESWCEIYPNPASSYITIQAEYIELNIYNQLGQKVMYIPDYRDRIDVSTLERGWNIVKIVTIEGISMEKLIIQ